MRMGVIAADGTVDITGTITGGGAPTPVCVVGAIDPNTGDTIASCPTPFSIPCLTGSGPLAPGQSYCDPAQISSTCPSGYQMDPVQMVCVPVPASTNLISGIPNTYLYIAGGILAFFLLKGKR